MRFRAIAWRKSIVGQKPPLSLRCSVASSSSRRRMPPLFWLPFYALIAPGGSQMPPRPPSPPPSPPPPSSTLVGRTTACGIEPLHGAKEQHWRPTKWTRCACPRPIRVSGNAMRSLLANPVHACGQVKLWDSEAQAGTLVARTRERGRGRTNSSRWCVAQGWMW